MTDPVMDELIENDLTMVDASVGDSQEPQKEFSMILRRQWVAKPCRSYIRPKCPVENVCVFYNTETEKCSTKEECVVVIQKLQEFQKKKGLADLHYNFLITSDGTIWEGRGFNRQPSRCVNNYEYDDKNYAVGFVGDWSNEKIPQTMAEAFYSLIQEMIKKNYIPRTYTLIEEKKIIPVITPKPDKNDKNRIRLTFNVRGGRYKW